jgi:hypothetical protein
MSNTSQRRIVDINLLPRDRRPLELSPVAAVFVAAFVIMLAALVPMSLHARSAQSDAAAAKDRAETSEAQLRDVQVGIASRRALSLELQQVNDRLAVLQESREQLQGGSRPLYDDLIWLWGLGFLTDGMRVTTVTGTADGFRVDGVAPGPLDAIAYADKLKSDGAYPSARVASFTPAQKDGVFTVEVTR